VQVFEPEFGPPPHRRSLFDEGAQAAIRSIAPPDDDYGRYLESLVPPGLRSLPHVGTKNVSFSDAEELLGLADTHPEKFVQCLPDEGIVDVASKPLVEIVREREPEELQRQFPDAWQALPLEWLSALLRVPAPSKRFLCVWLRA
jgi:hypothetical protein